MKIRYNFELQSDKSNDFEPWLHDIFKNIEIHGINNFTIRVLKVKNNRRIEYVFINKKNKTYVVVTKRKENILISGYYRELPSNTCIKPPYTLAYENMHSNTTNGKLNAVTKMLHVLDKCNAYSENTVPKISLNCTDSELPEINLIGGIISEVVTNIDSTFVFIKSNKTFCILNKNIGDRKISIGKFIIVNSNNNVFDVFFPSEVEQYYTLITDKN